ncbi:SH3 and multiple ankyrin repeat domains protein 2 [Kappamyces sp. JEL0680]|nr:SH3 and multiple ankyrin repeat domains protein 2 [Kappamyces sp. JEL0680]
MSTPKPAEAIVLRINIPILKLQKAIRVNTTDMIWTVNRQLEEKVAADIKDVLNYGMFVHGKDGKKGKFLDERNTVGSYHLEAASQIDFMLKCKIGAEPDNKRQKKLMEEIKNGNLDKVKERTLKTTEFNFSVDGETPMSIATMNNDPQMIMWLMDNGAFLDFRTGDKDQWKTPLHLAALHNKPLALKVSCVALMSQTLIQFGAWIDSKDTLALTPLYYAAGAGNSECVLRLLLAKADTEIVDEHGRTVLHQAGRAAAMNNYDCIVALLIDFGANLHHVNVGGNTPLHVAASRSCKESTKWLLMRGADVEKLNKSGKKPYDVALQAACSEICDIMTKFSSDQINSVTEYDGIVQNVLSSLSASIGKEYTPNLYYVKPPNTGSIRAKSVAPMRKTPSVLTTSSTTSSDDQAPRSAPVLGSISRGSRLSLKLPPPPIDGTTAGVSSPASSATSAVATALALTPEDLFSPSAVGAVPQSTDKESPPATQEAVEVSFDVAWRKIAPSQNPQSMSKLKYFLTEKIIQEPATDSTWNDLLSGVEDIEIGCVKAAEELETLRKQNEQLLQRVKQLEKA